METDELEKKKISSLFWQYAIPATIGTTVMAIYYIIDSIFVGFGPGLGDHALGGLGIALPIMNIMAAVGMLVGTGASSRVSIYLGRGDKKSASKILGTSVILTIVLTSIPIFFLYLFLDSILYLIGATSETFSFAREFLFYYLPANIFLAIGFNLTSIMRSCAYPRKGMYIIGIGVILNIILAAIFIFVFEWGMMGAALSNLIAMVIVACFAIEHFLNKKSIIRIESNYLKLNTRIIWDILSIGLAPFLIQSTASLAIFFINNRLSKYGGAIALEGYVIANRFVLVFIMIIVGLSQGMQPIIGYNYGAQNYLRVKETLVYTVKMGILIGLIGLLSGIFLADSVVSIFNPTPELSKEASKALLILTLTLPIGAYQMIVSSFFQYIGKADKSIFLSLSRQFIFLLPLLFILPLFLGLNGVWAALPLADVLAATVTSNVLYSQFKKI